MKTITTVKRRGRKYNQHDTKNKQAHAQQTAREINGEKTKTMKKVVSWNKKKNSIKKLLLDYINWSHAHFKNSSFMTFSTTANNRRFPSSSEWLSTILTFNPNWQVFPPFCTVLIHSLLCFQAKDPIFHYHVQEVSASVSINNYSWLSQEQLSKK